MTKRPKVLSSSTVLFYGPGLDIVLGGFKWTVCRGSDSESVSVVPHKESGLPAQFFTVSSRGDGVEVIGQPYGESPTDN
jgi:hypothetical protein